MKAFKDMGHVSGVFEIPDSSSNIRTIDARAATDLGWRHGTELEARYVVSNYEEAGLYKHQEEA